MKTIPRRWPISSPRTHLLSPPAASNFKSHSSKQTSQTHKAEGWYEGENLKYLGIWLYGTNATLQVSQTRLFVCGLLFAKQNLLCTFVRRWKSLILPPPPPWQLWKTRIRETVIRRAWKKSLRKKHSQIRLHKPEEESIVFFFSHIRRKSPLPIVFRNKIFPHQSVTKKIWWFERVAFAWVLQGTKNKNESCRRLIRKLDSFFCFHNKQYSEISSVSSQAATRACHSQPNEHSNKFDLKTFSIFPDKTRLFIFQIRPGDRQAPQADRGPLRGPVPGLQRGHRQVQRGHRLIRAVDALRVAGELKKKF